MIRYAAPGLLKKFLESKKPLTKAEAAKQLGIVPSAITQYIDGTIRPRDDVRERIARWSGGKIPVAAWRTASESKAISGQDAAFIPEDSAPDSQHRRKPTGTAG